MRVELKALNVLFDKYDPGTAKQGQEAIAHKYRFFESFEDNAARE